MYSPYCLRFSMPTGEGAANIGTSLSIRNGIFQYSKRIFWKIFQRVSGPSIIRLCFESWVPVFCGFIKILIFMGKGKSDCNILHIYQHILFIFKHFKLTKLLNLFRGTSNILHRWILHWRHMFSWYLKSRLYLEIVLN